MDIYNNFSPLLSFLGLEKKKSLKCFFHDDSLSSASFYEENGKEFYKCFACDFHLDVISFYQKKFNTSFPETLKKLEQIYMKVPSNPLFKPLETLTENGYSYLIGRRIKKAYKVLNITSGFYANHECIVFKMGDSGFGYRRINDSSNKKINNLGHNDITSHIVDSNNPVFVVEGIFDMMSLLEVDPLLNCISLNGVSQYRKCADFLLLNKIDKIVIWLDSDQAGVDTAIKMTNLLSHKDVCDVSDSLCDKAKDLNELLCNKSIPDRIEIITNIIQSATNELNIDKKSLGSNYTESFFNKILSSRKNIKSGFDGIDKVGGLDGLVVVGGITGLGKTSFVLNMIFNMYSHDPSSKFHIYSCEMSKEEILAKLISIYMYKKFKVILKYSYITKLSLYKDSFLAINGTNVSILDIIKNVKSKIDPFLSNILVSDSNVSMNLVKENEDKDKDFTVIIDYLQIIPCTTQGTDKQITDSKMETLLSIRKNKIHPIIVISSVNRGSYKQNLELSAFKDSGNIEFTSTMVIGLNYFSNEFPKNSFQIKDLVSNKIVVKILKNRSGGRISQILEFIGDSSFYNPIVDGETLVEYTQQFNSYIKDMGSYSKSS